MNNMGIPDWAAKQFGPKANTELELQLLRHFFDSWEALHGIDQSDPNARMMSEAAAECLVEASQAVRTFRTPAKIERIIHG